MRLAKVAAVAMMAVLLMTGCATARKADSQGRPGTDFSRYQTFAVLPLASSPVGDPGMALRLEEVAEQAAQRALWAGGRQSRPVEEADLAVALRTQSVPRVEVIDWGYAPYHAPWGPYASYGFRSVDVRTYEQRTLVIEMFDNRTKEMVWTGWANLRGRGKVQAQDLEKTIARILARFPSSG